MAKSLRVGLIGAGGIAQSHMDAWQKCPDAQVVAIADISKKARGTTAETFDVPRENLFEDYHQMLRKVELDAVDICTPSALHHPPTIAAFKAGCHVLVEKPVAISARQCEQMIEAGHQAKKLLMVGQVLRVYPQGLAMKRWVDDGLVGDIYWARATYLRSRGVPTKPSFIDLETAGGGPCYDVGVHALDLCLYLMGFPEPVSVSAATYLEIANKPSLMAHNHRKYTVLEDFAVAFIRLANGATISLEAGWAQNLAEETFNCILTGTKGGMEYAPLTLVQEYSGLVMNSTPQVNPWKPTIEGMPEQIRLFAEAIRSGGPSPVPGEQALITQRILDGVYKSGQKGKEIKV